MKKLITTDLGGHPVYFKDFEYIQEMIRELLGATYDYLDSAKVTILNSATFNLSTDGYTLDVLSPGYAYYQGEYFYIPVHSATGAGTDVPKWNIVETYDSRGLKTFHDEGVGDKNVYLVRELRLSYVAPAGGGVLFSETEYANKEGFWTDILIQTPWVSQVGHYPKYRITKEGLLQLNMQVQNTTEANNNSVIAVLPAEVRPSSPVYFLATLVNITELSIETKGEVVKLTTSGEIIMPYFISSSNQSFVYIDKILTYNENI